MIAQRWDLTIDGFPRLRHTASVDPEDQTGFWGPTTGVVLSPAKLLKVIDCAPARLKVGISKIRRERKKGFTWGWWQQPSSEVWADGHIYISTEWVAGLWPMVALGKAK